MFLKSTFIHALVLIALMAGMSCNNRGRKDDVDTSTVIPVVNQVGEHVHEDTCACEKAHVVDAVEKTTKETTMKTHQGMPPVVLKKTPEKQVCPEPVFAKDPMASDQDAATLSCVMAFDSVGLCADMLWLPVKEGASAMQSRQACVYVWSDSSPVNPPALKKTAFDLSLNLSMEDTQDKVMEHSDFDAKVEKAAEGVYVLYGVTFSMPGIWKAKFVFKSKDEELADFSTLFEVSKKQVDFNWGGVS